ncbi:MAG: ABC transporter ATP-binding protein [Bacteroidia bacterium]
MEVLRLHNFSVCFKQASGTFTAVDEINLVLNSGEILGLIGESGSGKSVASQSICRLIPEAEISGESVYGNSQSSQDIQLMNSEELRALRKREIAYIFQEPMTALNPLINCGKQIAESLSDKTDLDKQIISLLEKVELSDTLRIMKAYPHELSGGQRQRIMIAMALAKSPQILIADEPTTALDIAVQNEVLGLLKKLAKNDKLAILFITHDLLSLKNFADRIAVMYKGKIVETEQTNALLNSAQHPYTKALLESRANYSKKGKELAEIGDLLYEENGELKYREVTKSALSLNDKATDQAIISIKGLTKWHTKKSLFKKRDTVVLKEVSLNLYQGDSFGLVGESGSGKSTLAKVLLRIWKHNKGEVLVNGKKIDTLKNLDQDIQLVFQDPYSSLNPKHRIGEALKEVFKTSKDKVSKNEILELLVKVGLDHTAYDKYPHEFSGGQRQRICIAKALAKRAQILVLDEAVSALDVSVQAKILNLLNKLKIEEGLTYLLISHDMNVISYFCNRIAVLRHGEIQDYGNTDELIKNPNSEYTRSLLKESIY